MKNAIWGSKEEPRECKLCGCTHAKCNSTNRSGDNIVRNRVCSDCGRKFSTWEYLPQVTEGPPAKTKPKRKYTRKAKN